MAIKERETVDLPFQGLLEYRRQRIQKAFIRLFSGTSAEDCVSHLKQYCFIMLRTGHTPQEVLETGHQLLQLHPYLKQELNSEELWQYLEAIVNRCANSDVSGFRESEKAFELKTMVDIKSLSLR